MADVSDGPPPHPLVAQLATSAWMVAVLDELARAQFAGRPEALGKFSLACLAQIEAMGDEYKDTAIQRQVVSEAVKRCEDFLRGLQRPDAEPG
jgi:hypothetical protein